MIKQYAVNVENVSFEKLYKYCEFISPERVERIGRFRMEADKVRGTVAELLLRYLTIREYGIANKDISIEYLERGKPFFTGEAKDIHFNISHAQNYVVCAIGDSNVGIDVEHVKDKDVKIASKVLTKDEYARWNALPDETRNFEFYRFWTLKESYSKYVGKGLGIEFSKVNVSEDKNGFWSIVENPECILFSQKLTNEDYLSVCIDRTKKEELKRAVQSIEVSEITGFFDTSDKCK